MFRIAIKGMMATGSGSLILAAGLSSLAEGPVGKDAHSSHGPDYVKLGDAGTSGGWLRRPINTPLPGRYNHTAVWTGSEMIVWGGQCFDPALLTTTLFQDGARFNPALNVWTAVTTNGAPAPRYLHTAVWTGNEMIVWGGIGNPAYGDGKRYNPASDTWTSMTTNNAPSPRFYHTAVWTGQEMLVWGGRNMNILIGGRYNPTSDTWTAMNANGQPFAQSRTTSVWTGTEMIVFGGDGSEYGFPGGRYNPSSDNWVPTALSGAPSARIDHAAIWTGTEMVVWGGVIPFSIFLNDGGRYNPLTDSWTSVTTNVAPHAREDATAVWTGTEMIVWGGYYVDQAASANVHANDGGRYDPVTDLWTSVTTNGAPMGRRLHTAVWTGSEMIVFGGDRYPDCLSDPWSYFPTGPRLRLSLTQTISAVVSWPVWSTTFTLERNPDLLPAHWIAVTNPVSVVGPEYQVTTPAPADRQFFRLRAP